MWLLGLAPDDFRIAVAALKSAQEHRSKRERGNADYLSSKTASATARGITRWFGRVLSRMGRG